MRKKHAVVVLALLFPILISGSKFASQPSSLKGFSSYVPSLASDSNNYSIGVSPNEEYTWIFTAVREKNLELAFGSNWTDFFGLFGVLQRGYKFKANITSTQSNGTHYLLDFNAWNCLYRAINFSITSDCSCRYEYPIFPQNYTDSFELASVFPLFLPSPLVPYVFEANLTASYYDAMDNTHYGGGLYVYYDRWVNISGCDIKLEGRASYLENGALDYLRFFYINDTDCVECLTIESFKPYHLEQTSMSCQVGEEFTWVLVNYNATVLETYFEEEFFENYGLLPNPERMQSIKMKVDAVSENDTHWNVDYSLYNWTSLEDSFPESSVQSSSYAFANEPFNESRSNDGQIPFLIPEPTELYLRYGRLGDLYTAYYDLYRFVSIRVTKENEETLFGTVYYNRAGVLTSMKFLRSLYIGGLYVEQVAFEIALYYDSTIPNYVGIEEGAQFNYNIYTNDTIHPNMAFATKNFESAKIEVVKIFGEEVVSGRTMVIANFSMEQDNGDWELEDRLLVGYVHNDSAMYFDPLVPTNVNPFFLAPLFANNRMNWTEFAFSYNNFSGISNSNYYSVTELPNGFKLHYRDFVSNVTYCYKFNETGFLSEYVVYYNEVLYHNCTLEGMVPPPIVIDTDPPVITVLHPSVDKLCGSASPEFELTIEEESLHCTWVTIYDGYQEVSQKMSFISGSSETVISGRINESAWNIFPDRSLILRFWANDSSGNLNWKDVVVIKDATAPTVSILNLTPNEVFNATSPDFILTITEVRLNCTWYSINGSESLYFSGTSGTINQTIWGALPDGSVLIQFFALDDAGNLGTVEVIVVKFEKSESPLPLDSDGFGIQAIAMSSAVVLVLVYAYLFIATRKGKQKPF